ncbi:E3 ubiquitin-protein ligase TRIM9-like isoform X2 [Portunus trituberculatus]|uniref:E3 ubiquitin-protein ligase TRIM9-like isoform X2 n=1 Tax=Portunus trituberculatus TaxID=210409 RepID=UPI001E1D108D|nr:E3 ubiquitin-protein ligase TRIM9-like isoform X2 [Portunus trituberculatus]
MEQEETCPTLDHNTMENDKEALDCPVCLETYNEGLNTPKMMPCLHTLCASCIANLTSTVAEQTNPFLDNTTPRAGPESSFRLAFSRFASQPDLTYMNGRESLHGHHPPLRRVAGQGPISPTTPPPASRNSHDPSPPTLTPPSPHPSLPHKPRLSTVKRPEVSPPLPPKPGGAAQAPEPHIPRDVIVQCPLCRSEVSTSKLQTNRYVLAHMRDLARLSLLSPISPFPAPTSSQYPHPSAPNEEYWCEDCKQVATDTCSQHKLLLFSEWLETQKATLESLQMALEDQLTQHTTYIEEVRVAMKGIYYALNKATKFMWEMNKKVEDYKEELKSQPPISATACPREIGEELMGKVTQLEQLAKKVSEENFMEGDNEVMLTFKVPQQQIFIRTTNPNYAIVLTIADGHANV